VSEKFKSKYIEKFSSQLHKKCAATNVVFKKGTISSKKKIHVLTFCLQ
jgi:hypothetical protein